MSKDPARLPPIVRFVLSVVISVVLLPLLGLHTACVAGAITTETGVVTVATFIGVATATGTVRRLRIPTGERYATSFAEKTSVIKASLSERTWRESIINAVLGIAVLIAILTTGFVLTIPNDEACHSTATVYGTNDDGGLVAFFVSVLLSVVRTSNAASMAFNFSRSPVD